MYTMATMISRGTHIPGKATGISILSKIKQSGDQDPQTWLLTRTWSFCYEGVRRQDFLRNTEAAYVGLDPAHGNQTPERDFCRQFRQEPHPITHQRKCRLRSRIDQLTMIRKIVGTIPTPRAGVLVKKEARAGSSKTMPVEVTPGMVRPSARRKK